MDDRVIKPIQLPDEPEKPYPEQVPEFLREKGYEVMVVPALETAMKLSDKRCANVVLLGALSNHLQLLPESWQTALKQRFKASIIDLNLRAFDAGRSHP
jgi:indolepyruvate ferredoxin oxidoreductase beta subunit